MSAVAWACVLALLLGSAVQQLLAVDGGRDAFRQRVCLVNEPAAQGRMARWWWWVRFLLQELVDWASSLIASAAAIAACAVLLRRAQPRPQLRPKFLGYLAEALKADRVMAALPQRLHFAHHPHSQDPHPNQDAPRPPDTSLTKILHLRQQTYPQGLCQGLDVPTPETSAAESTEGLLEDVPRAPTPVFTSSFGNSAEPMGLAGWTQTSLSWFGFQQESAEERAAACYRAEQHAEQLAASLTQHLDAVLSELRVTNSCLACILPALERSAPQPVECLQPPPKKSLTHRLSLSQSSSQASDEVAKEAETGVVSLSSIPGDRGDSGAEELPETRSGFAQTSLAWLQAQQLQMAQERQRQERRVACLRRRLRDVISELNVTRGQLAETLAAQDAARKIMTMDVPSASSDSLVSCVMDAMLAPASTYADSSSEHSVSSASLASVASACTVVYRSRRRAGVPSSTSSAGAAPPSDAATSDGAVVDDLTTVCILLSSTCRSLHEAYHNPLA